MELRLTCSCNNMTHAECSYYLFMFTGTLEGTWQCPNHQDDICGSLTSCSEVRGGARRLYSIFINLRGADLLPVGLSHRGRWGKVPTGCCAPTATAVWSWERECGPRKPVQMGTELSCPTQPGPCVNHVPCPFLSVVPPAQLSVYVYVY